MIGLLSGIRVYLAPGATDMRKSYDGLTAVAREVLREDPTAQALFAFCNRRRTQLKILYFDGTGLCVLAKRLESGTFAWPKPEPGETRITLKPSELAALLGGFSLDPDTRRKWWRLPDPAD